jgi:hypothetical protein
MFSKLGKNEPNNGKFIKEFDGTTPVFTDKDSESKSFPYSEYAKLFQLKESFNNNGNNEYFPIYL